MSAYANGLIHGWADAEQAIRGILAKDITDAERLARIAWWAEAPVISQGVNVPDGTSRAAL